MTARAISIRPAPAGRRPDRRQLRRKWTARLVGAGAWVLAGPAAAQEGAKVDTADDDRGTVSATYVTDLVGDVAGGLKRGAAWLGRADLLVDLPASRLGLADGTAHLDIIGVQGGDFSGTFVGDAQVVSNVQAPAAVRPYEAWLQVPIVRDHVALKAGLIDLNTEFDVQNVGALFTNSSFGVGPDLSQAGENGPSIFPVTSLAAMVKLTGAAGSVRLGAFDAVSGDPRSPHGALPNLGLGKGALLIAEADHPIGGGREVQLGLWSFTRRADPLVSSGAGEASGRTRQRGAYAQVEGPIAARRTTRLEAWARLGLGNGDAQAINFYAGGGLAWRKGDEQQAGLAVAHARLGDPAVAAGLGDSATRAETTVELTYSTRVTPWLRVQPDVQYVVNPGWQRTTPDALVVGLRLAFETRLGRF